MYIDDKGEYAADPVFDAANTTDIYVRKTKSPFVPIQWARIDADLFREMMKKIEKNKEFLLILDYGENGEWKEIKLKIDCSTFYAVYFVPEKA